MKRYEFHVTNTREFVVGIEAENQDEAQEIFDELITDDLGDPTMCVTEINGVVEKDNLWKKTGEVWHYAGNPSLARPPATITVQDGEEFWLEIVWSPYTMVHAKYWSLAEAQRAAVRYLDNIVLGGE